MATVATQPKPRRRVLPGIETLREMSRRVQNALSESLDENARLLELSEARHLLEAEFSFDERRKALINALRVNRYRPDGSYIWRYIRAVYDATVVYEEGDCDGIDRYYQATYTIGEDGVATLGAAIEVREETNWVAVATPVAESGARVIAERTISLRESVVNADGRILVKIIDAGKGSSGIYPREVLERDIPKVFPKGTQMFANHATPTQEAEQPEGQIERLVAQFATDPVWMEDGPDGPAPYVWAEVFDDWKPSIEAKGHAIGVSINADGTYRLNENGEIEITALVNGRSVDFVTRAGRGGAIMPLMESARELNLLPAKLREAAPAGGEAIPPISQEEQEQVTPEQKAAKEAADKLAATEAENRRLRAYPAAAKAAREALSGLNLPEGIRAELIESQAQTPVFTEAGELDVEKFGAQVKEAAAAEIKRAQENYGWGGGNVEGMGGGDTTRTRESVAHAEVFGELSSIRASMGL